ncbi:MAG: SUMF1/EgtB/PvdO family nonheme iron enzyme [Armatimonadetes bacterium]|nr:SUMF1/EgtB/PvdO family nonheme iron enzyme [Armatimonadota bacterium]
MRAAMVVLVVLASALAQDGGPGGSTERGVRQKALSPVTSAENSRLFALVVGVSDYAAEAVPDLHYAAVDAAAVAQFLLTEGGVAPDRLWQLLDANATRAGFERVLGDELRRQVHAGDQVVLFFAGHGFADDNGELVLMLHDTDPERLVSSGLTAGRLGELLGYLGEAQTSVFLDSCFGGGGGRAFALPGRRAGQTASFGDKLRADGRFVTTASRAAEVAYEAEAYGHGLFTHFLLEGFRLADRNFDGKLTFAELYDYVFERVKSASTDRQHPDQTSAGNLVVLTPGSHAAGPAGTLQITSNPLGAEVYIDGLPALLDPAQGGRATAPTPPIPVPAGTHRVAAYKPEFALTQRVVEVRAGAAEQVSLELRRNQPLASLLLTDLRREWFGGVLQLNGHPAGRIEEAELFVPGLAAGEPLRLRLEVPGFEPREDTLTLEPGELRRIAVTLHERAEGAVTALPAGLTKGADGLFEWAKDGAPMVWVPGGTAEIGTDQREWFLAMPKHPEAVKGFWMDRFEVTRGRFLVFVKAAGYKPEGPALAQAAEGRDELPVTHVTWRDATAYAAWAGKALPSEIEWERAARGPDGWLYPYHAATFSEQKANVPRTRLRRTTPVGYFSKAGGDSPYGVADLSGNVAEWTGSRMAAYPGSPLPNDERFAGDLVVVRGGSYQSADSRLDSAAVQRFGVSPDRYAADLGFRCVLRPQ